MNLLIVHTQVHPQNVLAVFFRANKFAHFAKKQYLYGANLKTETDYDYNVCRE